VWRVGGVVSSDFGVCFLGVFGMFFCFGDFGGCWVIMVVWWLSHMVYKFKT
jgi:hypothetical protein